MSSKPEKSSGSAAASVSASGHDVPESLRRLDRLANVGLVSASLAHEIKNGLVAVKTYTEVLLEKGDDNQMTELVRRELTRIDGLASQMLRLSAPKASTPKTLNLHQTLDHSLRVLEYQLRDRFITLQRDYSASPDTVRGDEAQLQQAFMNLVLNAVEAIGQNGELTVRTVLAPAVNGGQRLRIFFQDTGPGITPENLVRLFEPFFTTKKNGTGLGLAITRRVAEDHQGDIEVTSEPGSGAVFIFSLPAT